MSATWSALSSWGRRRWVAALAAWAATVVVVAVPTDLIDTPLFSREIPPTWWSWPALLLNGVLAGMLLATYVTERAEEPDQRPDGATGFSAGRRWGGAGSVLTFFAVGCPVCNKLVLLALGTSGALTWFEPVQPVLSVLATAALGWALHRRLAAGMACPAPQRSRA